MQSQQVAGLDTKLPVLAKEIAAFTNRTHHVPGARFWQAALVDFGYAHPGLVKRRPDHLGHGGIHNGKIAVPGGLEVVHLRDQYAGVCSNRPAGLEYQPLWPAAHALLDCRAKLIGQGWLLLIVDHAKAPAQVQMLDFNAVGNQFVQQGEHPVQSVEKGRNFGELRTN